MLKYTKKYISQNTFYKNSWDVNARSNVPTNDASVLTD